MVPIFGVSAFAATVLFLGYCVIGMTGIARYESRHRSRSGRVQYPHFTVRDEQRRQKRFYRKGMIAGGLVILVNSAILYTLA